MTSSLDKYDNIYAKYFDDALEPPSSHDPREPLEEKLPVTDSSIGGNDGSALSRCQQDPPLVHDPPADPQKDAVTTKVGLNSFPYKADSPERDAMPLEIKLPGSTLRGSHSLILARHQIDPPEPKDAVASRDDEDIKSAKQSDEESSARHQIDPPEPKDAVDDTRSAKQSDEESSRDVIAVRSMHMQSRLDRFNANRMSMRSVYGSPSASISASSDPPSNDIDSRLEYLTQQSLSRRATIFPPCPSNSKSDRNAKSKKEKAHKTRDVATNRIIHTLPFPSSSLPMRSLAMKLISEQAVDGYRISQVKCSDCTHNMVVSSNDSGIRKCVFCPINDFRAIIQGAVSNRVMAAKRIQGDSVLVSDAKCKHCFSPTQQGFGCEVCPILDHICIAVARAVGRGAVLSTSCCNDCGSQQVERSDGFKQCIVCKVLNEELGEQQLYKPREIFADDASPLERYQNTLQETTQLLEKLQLRENDAIQIQLDEELCKAKNAQSLLGITMGNIVYERKMERETSGIRTELKEELLKAKEAQFALQNMLESTANKSDTPVEQDESTTVDVDISGLTYAISQREIDKGAVKEYIPPPKHFFQRGVPQTIHVKDRRGDISVGSTDYKNNQDYKNNLEQSAQQERQYVADCWGVRIHKQPSHDDRAESFDDDSIGTDDQYTVDISLNSYGSKLSARRHDSRKPPVRQSYSDKKSTKGRSRRWSILNLCGGSPSYDSSEEQYAGLDESNHTRDTDYRTDYRPHVRYLHDEYESRAGTRQEDDSSYDASMYSNITPRGILKSSRYTSQPSSFSVMTDEQSRLSHCRQQKKRLISSNNRRTSHRGQRKKRDPSPDDSVSSRSDYRKVSFYNHHHRDLDNDKLKTLTEEDDDFLQSQDQHPAVAEARRAISEYRSLSREIKGLY
eukprot:scaffold33532_cov133-Skeletonema_dohrnii-CCMP3373.AAC.3